MYQDFEREKRLIIDQELPDVSARLWAIESSDLHNARALLLRISKMFAEAPREGRDKDEPEGARTIRISDTLANEITDLCIEELTK